MSLARPARARSRRARAPASAEPGRAGRARRPRAWPARDSPPPHSAPKLEGTRVRFCTRGCGVGAARGASAPAGTRRRPAAPAPAASPSRSPARNYLPPPSPHPTTSIKVHFGRESGLRLPPLHLGGSAHFAQRELSDPGRGGGTGPGRPFLPGQAGSPRIELAGLLRRTFFAEAASAPRSARLRIPPRREEPRVNPFVPVPLPPPAPRAGPARAGRSRRERGGAARGWRTKPAVG